MTPSYNGRMIPGATIIQWRRRRRRRPFFGPGCSFDHNLQSKTANLQLTGAKMTDIIRLGAAGPDPTSRFYTAFHCLFLGFIIVLRFSVFVPQSPSGPHPFGERGGGALNPELWDRRV